jgi:GR25 family glycosyltransferase involved in LPS biosynthesis
LLSRHTAEVFVKRLVPMILPIDHAIDREWTMGLRSLAVIPLPVGQTDHQFGTTIGYQTPYKLPWYRRYWTVFPFRLTNETARIVMRLRQYRSLRKKLTLKRTSEGRYPADLGGSPSVALPLASRQSDDLQIQPTRKGA